MKSKMRGVIDPYTLGFLIVIFGGIFLRPMSHGNGESEPTSMAQQVESTEVVAAELYESDVFD